METPIKQYILCPVRQAMSAAANYAWVNRSSMTFLTRQAFAKAHRRVVIYGAAKPQVFLDVRAPLSQWFILVYNPYNMISTNPWFIPYIYIYIYIQTYGYKGTYNWGCKPFTKWGPHPQSGICVFWGYHTVEPESSLAPMIFARSSTNRQKIWICT